MKRLYLIITVMLLAAVTSGCRHGNWRLRGAKCRPGMSMPTYAQPPAQMPAQPPAGTCNQGYPPTGYMPSGGYMPSSDYVMDGGTMSGNVVVQEFPTTPIEGQTQVLQRPIISSPVVESIDDGDVITVPGPEVGPLPNR